MIEELSKEKEIAVDVEHNHERSFQGLTCLIQIATRQNDYIVDPFELWQHLNLLNLVRFLLKFAKIYKFLIF